MQQTRKTHSKLTPERIAELSKLAKKIDRSEGERIRTKAHAVFARHEILRRVIDSLKAARKARGLSLAVVGKLSGIGKENVSRLENDPSPNPTWDTIMRYAESVGMGLRWQSVPVSGRRGRPGRRGEGKNTGATSSSKAN